MSLAASFHSSLAITFLMAQLEGFKVCRSVLGSRPSAPRGSHMGRRTDFPTRLPPLPVAARLLITLIKCLKGHKSLGSLFEGVL